MRKDELRLVLGQCNRQLGYFRDTAPKIIAAIAAYAGLHAGSRSVALTEKTHRALVVRVEPDGATLREPGILRHEPALVALAWGGLYGVIHCGFLIVVHLVKWH